MKIKATTKMKITEKHKAVKHLSSNADHPVCSGWKTLLKIVCVSIVCPQASCHIFHKHLFLLFQIDGWLSSWPNGICTVLCFAVLCCVGEQSVDLWLFVRWKCALRTFSFHWLLCFCSHHLLNKPSEAEQVTWTLNHPLKSGEKTDLEENLST